MALTTTNFSGNKAEVAGGAIFAGCVEAIRFDCPKASPDTGLEFYQGEDWKALKQLESEADICPSWKGNHGNLYGPDVGTYATYANMTIEKAMRSVCVGGEDCVIDGYRTGEDLPEARVILLDGLGQGSPISHRGVRVRVNANLSSPDGEFMVGSIVLPMEEGSCTFQSVRGFVPPGKYELTVGFGEEAIKDIGIIVEVRDCSTGEIVAPATGVCQECSNTTYNFDLSAGACEPCPENGNCESRVITPGDGYWQKTPCSKHIHRCLPTSSCKRENRSKSLTDLVGDAANCTFDRSVIENYTQAQCAKVQLCFHSRTQAICVFIKGSRRAALRIMLIRIWLWPVGEVQEVPEEIRQRCSDSDIDSLLDRTDGYHRQWHTQRWEDGSKRATSPKCVYYTIGRAEVSSFSRRPIRESEYR